MIKRYLTLAIIVCISAITMTAQQINPSKTKMNNILLINFKTNGQSTRNLLNSYYLMDLSFDDVFGKDVIIEETEYIQKFGDFVLKESTTTDHIVEKFSDNCTYINGVLCYKSNPDSLAATTEKRHNVWPWRTLNDFETQHIYLRQTKNGKNGWYCYNPDGTTANYNSKTIDSQGRIASFANYPVSFSLDNRILKIKNRFNEGFYEFKWNKSYLSSHALFEAIVSQYGKTYAKIEKVKDGRWETLILYEYQDKELVPKLRVNRWFYQE